MASLFLLAAFILLPPTPPPLVPSLSKDQAWHLVLTLPEVQALRKDIPERSQGQVKLIVMDDGDAAPGLWTFYVGENHSTHTVRIHTLQVSAFSGMIEVWDFGRDEFVSLSDWRR